MKLFVGLLVLGLVATALGNLQCSIAQPDMPVEWIDMAQTCEHAVRNQIQKEVNASFVYLAMGAHFSRDTINRPGFAEHFFTAAKEEREHALYLMNYLTMRGKLTDSVTNLITVPTVETESWDDGAHALSDALKLEASVTKSIRDVIAKCEKGKFNDYHIVDYLSGDFLEEQYKGQRELAGKLSTLKKMMKNHGALGEFLFDKTLLQ